MTFFGKASIGFIVILNAVKDLKHSSAILTFSTLLLFVLFWLRILHFIQDDKPIIAVLYYPDESGNEL